MSNTEVNPEPATPRRKKRDHPIVICIVAIVLSFYALIGVGGLALAWRLNQGPLNADAALPWIEKMLSRGERLKFDVGSLNLSWGGRSNPIVLKMTDISLIGPMGKFMTIESADMGLSVWRLLLGQMHFTHTTVENLALRIIRLPNGAVTITGGDNSEGKPRARSAELTLDNIVNDLPAVEKLNLQNMRVVFEDQREAIIRRFDNVNIEISQSRGLGGRDLSGFLTGTLSGGKSSSAAVDFIYNASDKKLSAVASLEEADTRQLIGGVLYAANLPIIDMLVNGRAEVTLRNDFSLDDLKLQLKGDDGMLYWPRNYGKGLQNEKLTKFDLHVGYDPETQTIELSNATITVKGITVTSTGAIAANEDWSALKGDIKLNIPVVAVDALPAVWPKVWESGGREWLVDKMDKGRFSQIDVDIPLSAKRTYAEIDPDDIEIALDEAEALPEPEARWDITTGTIKGTFGFTGVTVDYRNPLLPARNTTGTGKYEGLSLTLEIESADIGDLDVSEGQLYFDDLITAGTGHAWLHFQMQGSVGAVFGYLEKEPIAYRKKVDLDASQARGNADVKLYIDFPTRHDMAVEDVNVKADAKLTDLVVPGAVKGLTLAGPTFDLEASANHFKLSGTGMLEGQPATIMWHEFFETPKDAEFTAKLEAKMQTDKVIRSKFIGSLEDRVDGIIPAEISYITKPNGHSDLAVTATLDNASIDFTNPFNAIKEKGASATAKLTGSLQDGNIKSIDTLSIAGSGMSLSSGNLTFGRDKNNDPELTRAVLNNLKLGQNDASVDVTWKASNDLTAKVTGASFDARNILGGENPAPATPATNDKPAPEAPPAKKDDTGFDVTLDLKQLWVGTRPLENAKGKFVARTDGSMVTAILDATVESDPVTLRYTANGNEADGLLLESSNAGRALAALGVTERVRGGTLKITGKPIKDGQPGDMQGALVIEKFGVRGAPAIAKLINLLSIPGLLSILEQDTGLTFDRAESEMTLLNRPGGLNIAFKEGRTTGASLGLTFEGNVDTGADRMDIRGTVVPMSEVNSMLSSIPLVGDILTGGKKGGGIFAATYSMKGPTADPDVSVNPLSVLTPGILRRILFEGTPSQASKPPVNKKGG